jgi:hypothetical protein
VKTYLGVTELPVPAHDPWRALKLRSEALPESARRALVEHWTRTAQLEHASVATFSYFSLQLLAIGAPPSLIEDAHRAALDEVKHAELCFALATTYAGHTIGPRPLAIDVRALTGWDLQSVAVGTVENGCVSETIAALEAEAAAALAHDDVVRAVQLRISDDESRHAELAWRFVRWAAQIGGAPVRAALHAAFERSLERLAGVASHESTHEHRLEAHGILSERRKHTVRAEVMNEVIRPVLADLVS